MLLVENPRDRSRRLRQESTGAEKKLWAELRAKRLEGFKFRRQHPIGEYFADFCCVRGRLEIEIDGDQHAEETRAYDEERTRHLAQMGFRVVRFANDEVLRHLDWVLDRILEELGTS